MSVPLARYRTPRRSGSMGDRNLHEHHVALSGQTGNTTLSRLVARAKAIPSQTVAFYHGSLERLHLKYPIRFAREPVNDFDSATEERRAGVVARNDTPDGREMHAYAGDGRWSPAAKLAARRSIVPRKAAALDGIERALEVTINASDSVFPPLKAAASVVLQLLKHIRLHYKNNKDCVELVEKAARLHEMLQEDFSRNVSRIAVLEQFSKQLEHVVDEILQELEQLPTEHTAKRVLAASTVSDFLSTAKEKIDAAIQDYQFSLVVWTAGAVHNINHSHTDYRAKDVISIVPRPKPNIFYGRDDEVADAVEQILEHSPAHIPVLGTGGIGKTSLALAVLHDERIKLRFSDRRFFLACDSATAAMDIVNDLVQMFSLATSMKSPVDVLCSFLDSSDCLLVLDNFETVYQKDSLIPVERLLHRLASLPNLNFIITMRGSQAPLGISWSITPHNAVLGSLSPTSALSTFHGYVSRDLSQENDDIVSLIAAVDYMPLAIVLLAHLVDNGNKPSDLLREWHKRDTRLLAPEDMPSRERNIQASIELSLSRILPDSPHAKLLYICSHLPDGLSEYLTNALDDFFPDGVNVSKRVLRNLALVHTGQQGQLCMLNPIRLYIRRRYTFTDAYKQLRCTIIDLAISSWAQMDESFPSIAARVMPDLRNIIAFLSDELSALTTSPGPDLCEAIIGISSFSERVAPSYKLIDQLLGRLEGSARISCLYVTSSLAFTSGDYNKATSHASEMKALAESSADTFNVALASMTLGNIRRSQGEYPQAIHMISEAQQIFSKLGSHWYRADAICALGGIYTVTGNYTMARKVLEEAQDIYVHIGVLHGQADVARLLAGLHRTFHHYDEAVQLLIKAREIFLRLGDRLNHAECGVVLGNIHQTTGSYADALALLTETMHVLIELDDRACQTDCLLFLGETHRRLGNYEEAQRYLEEARDKFRALGSPNGVADCVGGLGEIKLALGEYMEARDAMVESKELYKSIGNSVDMGEILVPLAEAQRQLGQVTEARQSLEMAHRIFLTADMIDAAEECTAKLCDLECD